MKSPFKVPVMIALLTFAGLFSALIGDDVFDWVSWLLLISPIGVICWKLLSQKSISKKTCEI